MYFHCKASIFCRYLLPSADILPDRCRCQEEVYTRGGSCPGWPYLEQRDKYHDAAPNKAREQSRCKDSRRKHQIHFAAPLRKRQVNMSVQLHSLFQETHFAWWLLPLLFWLIKNWGNLWEPKQVTRLQEPERMLGDFFFFQMTANMLFSNSRNRPILPPLDTQARA